MNKKSDFKIDWKFEKELVDYDFALDFMNLRVEEIINKKANNLIWVLEHPSIYTAGISAKDSDLLDIANCKVYKTNRGGKYTHHCPGMKIIYAMIDLRNFFAPKEPDVASFVICRAYRLCSTIEEFLLIIYLISFFVQFFIYYRYDMNFKESFKLLKVNIIKNPLKEYNYMVKELKIDPAIAMAESTGIVVHGDLLAEKHLAEEGLSENDPNKGQFL
jgi:hypothetical protein